MSLKVSNIYNPNILDEKDKNLFLLLFPDFYEIEWFKKPTEKYIEKIINNFPFEYITENDIKIFNKQSNLDISDSKYLGILIGSVCSGTSDLFRCAEIFAEFENRLKNIVPEQNISSLYKFFNIYITVNNKVYYTDLCDQYYSQYGSSSTDEDYVFNVNIKNIYYSITNHDNK